MSSVRLATPDDAVAMAAVLRVIVSERVHSAIDRAWTADAERAYLTSLSSRKVVHVAVDGDRIVGLQVLDRWSTLDELLPFRDHTRVSSAAEKGIANRAPMSCRRSVWHRSSQCPQRGIRLRHKCLEYVLRPSMTQEWRALPRKEWHHLDAVAQQRCATEGSEQS